MFKLDKKCQNNNVDTDSLGPTALSMTNIPAVSECSLNSTATSRDGQKSTKIIPNQLFLSETFPSSHFFSFSTLKAHFPPAAAPGTSQWDQCVMCKQRQERLKRKTHKKEKKHRNASRKVVSSAYNLGGNYLILDHVVVSVNCALLLHL